MTRRPDRIVPRRLHRCSAIGLGLALALQTLLAAVAFPAAASRGEAFVICTAQGLSTIVVGDGRAPAPANGGHDCPACLAGHCVAGFALPESAGRARAGLAPGATRDVPPTDAEPLKPAPRGGLASRGPPAGLRSAT